MLFYERNTQFVSHSFTLFPYIYPLPFFVVPRPVDIRSVRHCPSNSEVNFELETLNEVTFTVMHLDGYVTKRAYFGRGV